MLTTQTLEDAFLVYFTEMENCVRHKTYWALLHVVVCLPDICSALETPTGAANPNSYKNWCNRQGYLPDTVLNGEDWYEMRSRVLHQGRTLPDSRSRLTYKNFIFGQPTADGRKDHKRQEQDAIHLDVGELAREMT